MIGDPTIVNTNVHLYDDSLIKVDSLTDGSIAVKLGGYPSATVFFNGKTVWRLVAKLTRVAAELEQAEEPQEKAGAVEEEAAVGEE